MKNRHPFSGIEGETGISLTLQEDAPCGLHWLRRNQREVECIYEVKGGPVDRDSDFAGYASGRWQTLLRSAVLLGCSLPEAEDLTQTTLMRCYMSWSKVTKAMNRDAYVSRVMINAHRDGHRRRWRSERPMANVPEVAVNDQTDASDGVDAVHLALSSLSAKHREVVVLRFYLQLSESETAEALGVPPGTVKSRLSRAVHQLSTAEDLAVYREGNRS